MKVSVRIPRPRLAITEDMLLRILPIPLFVTCGATIVVGLTCLAGLNRVVLVGSVTIFTVLLCRVNAQQTHLRSQLSESETPSPQNWANKHCAFFPKASESHEDSKNAP